MQMGSEKTFDGAHQGFEMTMHKSTQSCPQWQIFFDFDELRASWCMPVPKMPKPRFRQSVSSPARMITASSPINVRTINWASNFQSRSISQTACEKNR